MRFIFFIEPPKIIRRIFKQLIWENSERKICLTFDDGPFPEPTEKILRMLEQNKSKAIFFLTGKNVIENISLVNEITAEGHSIANHSFNHSRKMTKMSCEGIRAEILETEKLLSDKQNFLKIFRPPYGRINLKMVKELKSLNYKVIMWSLLTEDYLGNFDIVKRNLDNHLRDNSIIVFHNNPKSSNIIEKSLEYTFNLIDKRGFKVGNTFSF
ncbi:MAG: polysaccharide deacetylase family protein [Ignavibacteria bacterium]